MQSVKMDVNFAPVVSNKTAVATSHVALFNTGRFLVANVVPGGYDLYASRTADLDGLNAHLLFTPTLALASRWVEKHRRRVRELFQFLERVAGERSRINLTHRTKPAQNPTPNNAVIANILTAPVSPFSRMTVYLNGDASFVFDKETSDTVNNDIRVALIEKLQMPKLVKRTKHIITQIGDDYKVTDDGILLKCPIGPVTTVEIDGYEDEDYGNFHDVTEIDFLVVIGGVEHEITLTTHSSQEGTRMALIDAIMARMG